MTDSTTRLDDAINHLKEFGLSTYAARTYVALVSLGGGTATEVSDNSEVPRTRVYDAVAELKERRLVVVKDTDPKEFVPVDWGVAERRLRDAYETRLVDLSATLSTLSPAGDSPIGAKIESLFGREAIDEYVADLVDRAADAVTYVSRGDHLTSTVTESLLRARERGVTLRTTGVHSEDTLEIADSLPGATPFDSGGMWADSTLVRALLVDETSALASTKPDAQNRIHEAAVVQHGSDGCLVVLLGSTLTWLRENQGNRPTEGTDDA